MILSLHLLPHEHSVPGVLQLDDLNALMIKWRKAYGRGPDAPQPAKLIVGTNELDYLLSMCWSSNVTREFSMRATKRDWYLISHHHFHDELRAGRFRMGTIELELVRVDELSHCELVGTADI